MRSFVRDNSLSLFFGLIFLAALVGQSFAGMAQFNQQQLADSMATVSYAQYLTSSDFAVDVAENWQSEYLQFLLYIFATVWLVQRGSVESEEAGDGGTQSDKDQRVGPHATEESPGRAGVGGPAGVGVFCAPGLLFGALVPGRCGGF